MTIRCAGLGVALLGVGCASAQPEAGTIAAPLSLAYRNTTLLPASTTDQHGVSFPIAGLSGITWLGSGLGNAPGAHDFVAVMDNSNKLVKLTITFAPSGAAASVVVNGGLAMGVTRDFEGVAPGAKDASGHVRTVFVSEEDSPAILEVRLADGAILRTITPPTVFAGRRANFGFESCTSGPGILWTGNEEALTVDGPQSTVSAGTVVRLLRTNIGSPASPTRQYAYRTQPIHGAVISGSRSGLSDMVALPDGRVMTLERSFALSGLGFFQTRIYELSFDGATEVSGFTSGLAGQTYNLVGKRLLWSGNLNNMEGLALGPELPNHDFAMVGIVDNGDPISKSAITTFALGGLRGEAVFQPDLVQGAHPKPPTRPK